MSPSKRKVNAKLPNTGSIRKKDMAKSLNLPEGETTARLLVVDDEANIRAGLRDLLSLKGYHVEEAGSGYEALALLENTSYDLMMLDMLMPGMDGVEVMRRARKMHPNLPIIVLTAHASLESAIAAVKLDATDYLLKPFDVENLIATVSRAVRKHTERQRRRHLLDMMGKALNTLRETEGPTISLSPTPSPPTSPKRFLRAGPITLDRQRRLVTVQDEPARRAELTEGETDVLVALMDHADEVLSCSKLVKAAMGYEPDEWEAQSMIRPYIFRLRRKIEKAPEKPRLIRTVRGRGYFLSLS
jgi:DNA-binding response OmpR family regulator